MAEQHKLADAAATNHDTPAPHGGIDFSQFGDVPEIASRILNVAMRLFAQKGYSATSVREIVQEAQVTNPMLYYYFDNKEGLFRRLIDTMFSLMNRDMYAILEDDGTSLRHKLEAVIRLYFQSLVDAPMALRFVYSVLFSPSESTPFVDILALRKPLFDAITALFEREMASGHWPRDQVDDAFDAEFLCIQFTGLINQHMISSLKQLEACCDHALTPEHLVNEAQIKRLATFFFAGARGGRTATP